jgi:cobalt-zinc-cadmium efflux system membrane fusion protein
MKIFIILTILLTLTACDRSTSTSSTVNNDAVSSFDPNLVKPNDDLVSRLTHLTLGETEWKTKLKVSGSIELDEKHVARVGTTVAGRVTEIKVLRGDVVKKGDVLALMHSSALAEAQLSYLKSHAAYQLAQKSVQRAKALFKEDVISLAELQRRESELLSSEAEWNASRDRMTILGMSIQDIRQLEKTRQINSNTAMRATIDGVVIERKVSQGEVLEPADHAYTIADLSQVWVVGEVPERYSAQMYKGKEVKVFIPALLNETRLAQLTYVADTVTPQTRTLRIRAPLENTLNRLKPEMLATLQIEGALQKRIVIPVKAVFREDNTDRVFVKMAEKQYVMTAVKLGEEEDGYRPVESGLQVGQTIVVEGVFPLNADRLLKQQEN